MLPSLPYDVLYLLIRYLSFEDAVCFGLSSPQFNAIILINDLCRFVLQTSACYSPEAISAQNRILSYAEAVRQLYARRRAIQRCDPFMVKSLGKAERFLYSGSILCKLNGDTIALQNLKSRVPDITIHLTSLHQKHQDLSYEPSRKVKLLCLHGWTLAILLQAGRPSYVDQLVVLVRNDEGDYEVSFTRYLGSFQELFVKMNDSYMYYGTYGEMTDRRRWKIRAIALPARNEAPSEYETQLEDLWGHDIGSTVNFKLYNGYFYAVSNQTQFPEVVNWVSFYTVIRFPLGNASNTTVEVNRAIHQHVDGPLHDRWTDLSLQHDECSGKLYIVESRQSWPDGGSKRTRNFYRQPVWFEPTTKPADDRLASSATSEHSSNSAPERELKPEEVHPEYGNLDDQSRSFIIARTHLKSYNLSSSTFIDLVEDDSCCGLNDTCLRLRVGSRRPAPIQPLLGDCSVSSGNQAAQGQYIYNNISMWPPSGSIRADDLSSTCEAHRAMNAHFSNSTARPVYLGLQVTACSDERSVTYMVRTIRPGAEQSGTVVILSFDPSLATSASLPVGEGYSREEDWWPRPQGYKGC